MAAIFRELAKRVGVIVGPQDMLFERSDHSTDWAQLTPVMDATNLATTLREMESPATKDEGDGTAASGSGTRYFCSRDFKVC